MNVSGSTIDLRIGTTLADRYRVVRLVGAGGMGTVYEAEHIQLRRRVALKVLRPGIASDEMAIKRFQREARAASSIQHLGVVEIFDFGQLPSGEVYYTMELLEGRDLAELLRQEGVMPWPRAGWIVGQLARALAVIHNAKIIHRDIKPANCFLLDPQPGDPPDFVKILDFGIANLQDSTTTTEGTVVTQVDSVTGSAFYMSPEQAEGGIVDARTDVYALGVTLYELVTGVVPFSGTTRFEVMRAHQKLPPPPPRERVPSLPTELEAVILRAMAKRPEDRFQSMAAFDEALSALVAQADTLGPPIPVAGASTTPALTPGHVTPSTPNRARPFGLAVLAVTVFLAAMGATLWLRSQVNEPSKAVKNASLTASQTEDSTTEEPLTTRSRMHARLLAPPEKQYNPFEDPFGAPRLRAHRTVRLADADAGGSVDHEAVDPLALEASLPEEPWTLPPTTVSGRLLNDDGEPLAKARACLWLIDPRAPVELRRQPLCTRSDDEGQFRLEGVAPGFYDLYAFADRYLPASYLVTHNQPLVAEPNTPTEGLTLTLVPGGVEARGVVQTLAGEPIAEANVATLGPAKALTQTDASGAFTLWVPNETPVFVAWADGFADTTQSGSTTQALTIRLRRESVLTGRVVDAETGAPLPQARVRAGFAGQGIDPLVYTDDNGAFRIPGLTPGRYEPTARTEQGFGTVSSPLVLGERSPTGQVTIEVITLEPPPDELLGLEPDADDTGTGGDELLAGFFDGAESGGLPLLDGFGMSPVLEPVMPLVDQTSVEAPPGNPDPAVDEPAVAETPAAPEEPKPPTDKDLRRGLARKLRRCGRDGTIEVRATYVLDSGRLFQPKVSVRGAAKQDPQVEACANQALDRFKLPQRRELSEFKPLTIELPPPKE